MDALNTPVKRTYNRKELNTGDLEIGQHEDIDANGAILHGESLVNLAGEISSEKAYLDMLKFNEEPVTIIINESGRSDTDHPETHVPVQVNGKGAEVLYDGKWIAAAWLPINQELTTKRKYVEVLIRSKSDTVRTVHEEATVERPRNSITRRTKSNYPVQILRDDNPMGREWASRLMMNH